MTQSCSLSLVEALGAVPDPRDRRGRRHPLPGVLSLLAAATMCGCRNVSAALQWGREQGKDLAAKLGLAKHGIPSGGMMSTLLRRLDLKAFEAALSRWAAAWAQHLPPAAEGELEAWSVDGKTPRGSQSGGVPGVHLLALYAARLGLVIKQVSAGATKEDGGEILAAPKLLEGLVLEGKVITGDAIHAQRKFCREIVEGGGDYLLTVKENQPSLYRELEDLFRSPCTPLCPRSRRTSMGRGSSGGRCGPAGNWRDGGTGRGSEAHVWSSGRRGTAGRDPMNARWRT